MDTIRWLLLLASVAAAAVATILGFRWLGTDGRDWPGWLSLAVLCRLVAEFAVRPAVP